MQEGHADGGRRAVAMPHAGSHEGGDENGVNARGDKSARRRATYNVLWYFKVGSCRLVVSPLRRLSQIRTGGNPPH